MISQILITILVQSCKKYRRKISLLIMGDFNINLVNYDSHPETNDFINLMVSHYLPQILHPTRVTGHSATIIDNIFFNTLEFDTLSGNLLTKFSDHFPQFLVVKNAAVDQKNCYLLQYDYSNFSENLFLDDFKKLSWEDIVDNQNSNINVKFGRFYEEVYSTAIHHAPLKKVNKKQLKLQSKPWVTLHIQKLIKHRDKLLRKLKKSNSEDTEELYKKFRNRVVVSENGKSKINYFDTYFQANKSNMKNLWMGIKSIINTKSKKLPSEYFSPHC